MKYYSLSLTDSSSLGQLINSEYDMILIWMGKEYGPVHICMSKPTICIGQNKAADKLRGYREADHRLCFRYTDSTIPPLSESKISSL